MDKDFIDFVAKQQNKKNINKHMLSKDIIQASMPFFLMYKKALVINNKDFAVKLILGNLVYSLILITSDNFDEALYFAKQLNETVVEAITKSEKEFMKRR